MKKRIFGLALLLTMLVCFTLPAYAAGTGKITINAPSNLTLTGQTFKAYKIFNLTYSAPDHYAYTINSNFTSFTDFTGLPGETLEHYISNLQSDTDEMNNLAYNLMNYITTNSIMAAGLEGPVSAPGLSATISNLDDGYYLVYGSGTDGSAAVVAACTLNTVAGGGNVPVTLKADVPTIAKKIDKDSDLLTSADRAKVDSVNIGDEITFVIESQVPVMTGYPSYKFTVSDYPTPTTGLVFSQSSLKVVVGVEQKSVSFAALPHTNFGTNDCLVDYNNTTNKLTITYDPAKFINLTPNTPITISYKGVLSQYAIINGTGFGDGNKNHATITYSNNPFFPNNTGETTPDEVFVRTYGLDIFKYEEVIIGTPKALPGATFQLRKIAADASSAIKFNSDNTGYYPDSISGLGSVTMTSQAAASTQGEGVIRIRGLDSGTYYLVEMTSPAGFDLITDPIVITINDSTTRDVSWVNHPNVKSGPSNELYVLNTTGGIFPSTGGGGTTLFTIIGISLISVAAGFTGIMFFVKRRRLNVKLKSFFETSGNDTSKSIEFEN